MPKRLHTYLVKTAEQIYDRTMRQATDGFWCKSRVDESRRLIKLRKFDTNLGLFVDRAHRDSFEDFTAELLHGIRNTLHGYRMMDHAYESLVSGHSCEVSDVLPDLATVFLFSLLADPDQFFRNGWAMHVNSP